ncbi:hypothetical protein PspLS_09797 [Pyricularia sp. CBS 133598]|nr:hypothetical protein PspLS_09797 [Pyricularia sp. CBS 133598]
MYSFKALFLLSVFGLAQLAATSPAQYGVLEARQKFVCSVGSNGDGTNPADSCTLCLNGACTHDPHQPACCGPNGHIP